MNDAWINVKLNLINYKNTGTHVIKGYD